MEAIIIIAGTLLLIVSFVGCFVPALPGPTLAYMAILLRYFSSTDTIAYSTTTLAALGIIMAVVFLLDYIIPSWMTRKMGGSKYASRGALIGMLLGIIFTPIGMLLGMFLGALVGELMHSNNTGRAVGVACYTFVGFLLTTGIKFIYCCAAAYYFFFP
ncbi:MAG: DUF456 domain-containing protein [Prevotellaceae bacterium]|jgi:uncharacterized protein YqgC (DUF456 family)|nr:DUF456 domain-containing protein [Prevotellaceae bacterium]